MPKPPKIFENHLDMLIYSTFAILTIQPLWQLIQDWKQGQDKPLYPT